MKTTLEKADHHFLEQLHQLAPATVLDLCESTGVTATAVRQRLVRLQGMNLISRNAVRTGRGRPHHRYELTMLGLRHLGDNYSDLAQILWRELRRIEEPAIREQIVARIRDALVERYGRVVSAEQLDERIYELQRALQERGFNVEVEGVEAEGTLPILRENHCPYPELATLDPGICELEQQVYQQVLGVPVTLTQCCLDGHNSCEFRAGVETAAT